MLRQAKAQQTGAGRAQAHYRDHDKLTYARSTFVVHNIAHQGRGPMTELAPLEVPSAYTEFFRLDDPIGGVHMNVMKAGLMSAHRIVAVSHGCALTRQCTARARAECLLVHDWAAGGAHCHCMFKRQAAALLCGECACCTVAAEHQCYAQEVDQRGL